MAVYSSGTLGGDYLSNGISLKKCLWEKNGDFFLAFEPNWARKNSKMSSPPKKHTHTLEECRIL
jgi:hypothetical protein